MYNSYAGIQILDWFLCPCTNTAILSHTLKKWHYSSHKHYRATHRCACETMTTEAWGRTQNGQLKRNWACCTTMGHPRISGIAFGFLRCQGVFGSRSHFRRSNVGVPPWAPCRWSHVWRNEPQAIALSHFLPPVSQLLFTSLWLPSHPCPFTTPLPTTPPPHLPPLLHTHTPSSFHGECVACGRRCVPPCHVVVGGLGGRPGKAGSTRHRSPSRACATGKSAHSRLDAWLEGAGMGNWSGVAFGWRGNIHPMLFGREFMESPAVCF